MQFYSDSSALLANYSLFAVDKTEALHKQSSLQISSSASKQRWLLPIQLCSSFLMILLMQNYDQQLSRLRWKTSRCPHPRIIIICFWCSTATNFNGHFSARMHLWHKTCEEEKVGKVFLFSTFPNAEHSKEWGRKKSVKKDFGGRTTTDVVCAAQANMMILFEEKTVRIIQFAKVFFSCANYWIHSNCVVVFSKCKA